MTLSKSDSTSCSYGVFVLPAVKFVLGRSFLFLRWHPKFTLWNHLTALNLNLQTNQALTLESVNVFQWWGSSALPAVRLRWSCLIVLDIVGDDCTSIGARFLPTTARPMGGNLVPVGQDHQKGRLAVTRLWWSFPRHPRRSKRSSDLLLPAAACQSAAHPAITLHVLFYPCCLPWPVLGLLLQFLPGIRKPSFCCFFLSWLPHFDFARVFSINSSFLKFFFFFCENGLSLFLFQVWHEGQQEAQSCEWNLPPSITDVLRLSDLFTCVLLLLQDYSAWSHLDLLDTWG